MPESHSPLKGLKVLDLSVIVAGGTASSLLADFGVEVIKVERPGTGDPLRNWGPFYDGVSLWWKVYSRNKKSITLDLSRPEGQKLLKELVRQADLLIEGFARARWSAGGWGRRSYSRLTPAWSYCAIRASARAAPTRTGRASAPSPSA